MSVTTEKMKRPSTVNAGQVVDVQDPKAAENAKKKGGKRRLVVIALLVMLVGAGTYKFALAPAKPPAAASAGGSAAAVKPGARPGPLVPTDAVTVNLSGGHYLRIALALQFTSKVSKTAPPDTSVALDQIISYLTGRPADQLNTADGLASVKAALRTRIAAAYPKDPLLDLLITSYVIQ